MTEEPGLQPSRLLVLGASGAFGGGLREVRESLWPDLVREQLAARVGEVDLLLRRFYVHSGEPFTFLERELSAGQPDFIVLQCTSFPATQRTVAHRVDRLLGKRAAAWTEDRVRAFDRKTRRQGRVRQQVNRASHRIARRLVGTAPIIDYRPLVDGYLKAIDRIAMVETAAVAIIGTGFASDSHRKNNPQVDALKERFNAEISGAARRKHLGWVDSDAVTRNLADPESTFLDQLHRGLDWHRGIAEGVVAALVRA